MEIQSTTMTRLQVLSSLVIFFVVCFVEYQVTAAEDENWMGDTLQETRVKRQLEDFDSDDATPNDQEPGFWDRVVKVALRLFNKFIEWLNSS